MVWFRLHKAKRLSTLEAKGATMLVELSILPLVGDGHLSDELAEVLKLVDAYGLPYQLTPTATCIEGTWNETMELARQCHERVRSRSSHVVTMIKIEDEQGETDKLNRNVTSVEQKAGRSLSSPVNAREGEI
jgi:uncharacterized protein YqgV (UPF0045/DUF77 family)